MMMLRNPSSSGLCGSPSRSANAWCLRWQATHSFVDRCRKPQPDSHWHFGDFAERHTAVRLRTVKKERHAHIRDVTGEDDEQKRLPPMGSQHREPWHAVPFSC